MDKSKSTDKVEGGRSAPLEAYKPLKISGKNVEVSKAHGARAADQSIYVVAHDIVGGIPLEGSSVQGLYYSLGSLLKTTESAVAKAEKLERDVNEKFANLMTSYGAGSQVAALFQAHKNIREAAVNNLLYAQQVLSAVSNIDDEALDKVIEYKASEGKKGVKTNLREVLKRFEVLGETLSKLDPSSLTLEELKSTSLEMKELQNLLTQVKVEGRSLTSGVIAAKLEAISAMISTFDKAVDILESNKITATIVEEMRRIEEKEIEMAESDKKKYFAIALVGLAILMTALLVGLLAASGVGAIVVLAVGGIVGGTMLAAGGGLGIAQSIAVSNMKTTEYQEGLLKLIDDAATFLKPLA